jgi:hypothetical protein
MMLQVLSRPTYRKPGEVKSGKSILKHVSTLALKVKIIIVIYNVILLKISLYHDLEFLLSVCVTIRNLKAIRSRQIQQKRILDEKSLQLCVSSRKRTEQGKSTLRGSLSI